LSTAEQLEMLQRHIARLRSRIEQQAAHVERLVDYPELAERAGAILEQDTESLRRALIQLEQIEADAKKEDAALARQPAGPKSDVA
jgi:tRNA U34 5-carboxymethylaminomethyl modifying GTPase MnmE/TrmE